MNRAIARRSLVVSRGILFVGKRETEDHFSCVGTWGPFLLLEASTAHLYEKSELKIFGACVGA